MNHPLAPEFHTTPLFIFLFPNFPLQLHNQDMEKSWYLPLLIRCKSMHWKHCRHSRLVSSPSPYYSPFLYCEDYDCSQILSLWSIFLGLICRWWIQMLRLEKFALDGSMPGGWLQQAVNSAGTCFLNQTTECNVLVSVVNIHLILFGPAGALCIKSFQPCTLRISQILHSMMFLLKTQISRSSKVAQQFFLLPVLFVRLLQ